MIYAEKGNRVIRISEQDVQRYVAQGYQITNEWGAVIQASVPTDPQTLKLAYKQHTEEIAQLTEMVKNLKAQNEELLKALSTKQTVKADKTEKVETADATEETTPKQTRKKKTVEE